MIRLKLFILSLIGWFIFINMSNVFAINLQVPGSQGNEDLNITWMTQIETDESTIFDVIQIINTYLWFSIWLVCFVVLIISWFNLITAQWDATKTKKANTMISGAIIWLIICILSYATIRLLINLDYGWTSVQAPDNSQWDNWWSSWWGGWAWDDGWGWWHVPEIPYAQ